VQVLRRIFPGEIDLFLRPVLGPRHFSDKSHDFGGFAGFSGAPDLVALLDYPTCGQYVALHQEAGATSRQNTD
jgi:hypothetical protein